MEGGFVRRDRYDACGYDRGGVRAGTRRRQAVGEDGRASGRPAKAEGKRRARDGNVHRERCQAAVRAGRSRGRSRTASSTSRASSSPTSTTASGASSGRSSSVSAVRASRDSSGVVKVKSCVGAAIKAGDSFITLITGKNPNGEIRGQIRAPARQRRRGALPGPSSSSYQAYSAGGVEAGRRQVRGARLAGLPREVVEVGDAGCRTAGRSARASHLPPSRKSCRRRAGLAVDERRRSGSRGLRRAGS